MVWNRNVFLQSRIAAFQVYDKMDNFNQKVCHVKFCEHKNKNFQNNGKIKIIAYLWFWSYVLKKFLMKNFLFCVVAGSFASFTYLNSILRLKNTFNFQLTIKKLFFLLTSWFINFKYSKFIMVNLSKPKYGKALKLLNTWH